MIIRRYQPSDLPAVADLVARLNARPESCISYFDEDPKAVRAYLEGLSPKPEIGFVVGYSGDRLVGVFGLEYDEVLNRTWLHGPVVDSPAWHNTADALYQAALELLPDRILDLELAFDTRNYQGIAFARRHGFTPPKVGSAVLTFTRAQATATRQITGQPLLPEHADAFCKLHDLAFPNTYYTGKQMQEMVDDTHVLFGAVRDGEFLGSVFVEADLVAHTGFIHFLAVTPEARGRGVGRDLLAQAVTWVFAQPEAKAIHLTVELSNSGAIGLYQSFGFTRELVIRGYGKLRAPVVSAG